MHNIKIVKTGLTGSIGLYSKKDNIFNLLDEIKRKYNKDYKIILSTLEMLTDRNDLLNEKRFEMLNTNAFEIKTNPSKLRLFGFKFEPDSNLPIYVLKECVPKPTNNKQYKPYIQSAQSLAENVIKLKNTNEVKIWR